MAGENVFLSYAHNDGAYVQALHDRLQAKQVEVWWDRKQPPGCDFTEQLYTWVTSADAVLVIVSQQSAQSYWVKNEVWVALQHKQRVIPVVIENARGGLWMLIGSAHHIDVRDGRDPVPEILYALRGDDNDHGRGQFNPRETLQLFLTPPSATSFGDRLPPPPASPRRARITIELEVDIGNFDQCEQEGFRQLLARLANIALQDITMQLQTAAGTVRMTVELPESTAHWLLRLYQRKRPLIALLDIQTIEDFQVMMESVPPPTPAPWNSVLPSILAPSPAPQFEQARTRTWRWPSIAWRRLVTPALAFAAALLLVWGLAQQQRIAELNAEAAVERDIAVDLHDDHAQEFPLTSTSGTSIAKGQVWVSPEDRAVALYTKDLPQLPAGQVYQLWLKQDNQVVSVLTFDVDQNGRTWHIVRVAAEQMLPAPQRAFITRAPAGGSAEPTGPVYLQGDKE
jgi:anti-sigma-K factor RskA